LLPTGDVEGECPAGGLEHRRWTEQHGRHALRLEDAVAPLLGAPGTLGPLTGSITPGTLLVVRAPDDAARATFLALAAGRLRPASGVVAVHDRLAPDDLAAIQSRAQWIGAGERVAERLAAIGGRGLDRTVVVIEHIGDLAHAAATDDMLIERLDALLEAGATLIVGSRKPHPIDAERHLHSALRAPDRLRALSVQRSTASTLEGAHACTACPIPAPSSPSWCCRCWWSAWACGRSAGASTGSAPAPPAWSTSARAPRSRTPTARRRPSPAAGCGPARSASPAASMPSRPRRP